MFGALEGTFGRADCEESEHRLYFGFGSPFLQSKPNYAMLRLWKGACLMLRGEPRFAPCSSPAVMCRGRLRQPANQGATCIGAGEGKERGCKTGPGRRAWSPCHRRRPAYEERSSGTRWKARQKAWDYPEFRARRGG